MKIMVSELKDGLLDYWVAMASDLSPVLHKVGKTLDGGEIYVEHVSCKGNALYQPSADWSQGGPIIEREAIELHKDLRHLNLARIAGFAPDLVMPGKTPLIAAMRCFVASKFGKEVDDSQAHNL